MDTDNKTNSSDEVNEAVQQLQTSLSRFLQEDQRNDENLSRLMDQPSEQLMRLESKIDDVRRETEKNRDLIRNYRQ